MKDKSRTKTINKSSSGKKHHAIRASADSFLSKILALIVLAGFVALLAPSWRDAYDYVIRERGRGGWEQTTVYHPPPPRRPIVIYRDYRPVNVTIIKPARKRVLGIF